MTRPTLALFGAIDRNNYGDLLFPILIERLLDEYGVGGYRVQCVGLKKSDLIDIGARRTKGLRWMTKAKNMVDGSAIIIVGGEVLGASWSKLHSYLLPQRIGDYAIKRLGAHISGERLDGWSRRLFGATWEVPFVIDPAVFPNHVKTLCNAIGGSALGGMDASWQRAVLEGLGRASFVSVRDRVTQQAINAGAGSGLAKLYPDAAALLSDFFSREILYEMANRETRQVLDRRDEGFLCFQIHRYFGRKRLDQFASQLDQVARRTGLRIVLLPIGLAAGHSDQVSLAYIREKMEEEAWMPTSPGIFNVMALLAHSQMFVGTSLHGSITAMSFGVPYLSLAGTPKCESYLDSWSIEPFRRCGAAGEIAEDVCTRMDGHAGALADQSAQLKARAREGFEQLVLAL